jgi:adenylyltransferase/sulfurtransferase
MGIQNITPLDLKERLDAGEDLLVIDVRQDWELEVSSLDFAEHIMLNDLPARAEEVPQDKTVVMICRTGGRSMKACMFLAGQGWDADNLLNLEGGILGWARDVDPSLPQDY